MNPNVLVVSVAAVLVAAIVSFAPRSFADRTTSPVPRQVVSTTQVHDATTSGATASRVVAGSVEALIFEGYQSLWLYRFWDSGLVDRTLLSTIDDDCDLDLICTQVMAEPTGVAGATASGLIARVIDGVVTPGLSGNRWIYRFWDDGRVERRVVAVTSEVCVGDDSICGWDTLIGSGQSAACDADISGDNEVSFDDLLILLSDWGTCDGGDS